MLWWRFMLSIHPEVKDVGNEDETNYETEEINKENMRVLHFYCWPKIGKYKTYNKIRQANLLQVLSKEGVEESKRRKGDNRFLKVGGTEPAKWCRSIPSERCFFLNLMFMKCLFWHSDIVSLEQHSYLIFQSKRRHAFPPNSNKDVIV